LGRANSSNATGFVRIALLCANFAFLLLLLNSFIHMAQAESFTKSILRLNLATDICARSAALAIDLVIILSPNPSISVGVVVGVVISGGTTFG
jgi:hypothetical protein